MSSFLEFFSILLHQILTLIVNIFFYTMILLIIGLAGGKKSFDFVLNLLKIIAGAFSAIFTSPIFKSIFQGIWNIIVGMVKLLALGIDKLSKRKKRR